MFIPEANLIFFFLRHTVSLDQSLKAKTWKGRTFSRKKTQVEWRILFATPNLFAPHLLTPLSGNATLPHMHFFGLPFQIQKIFHVLQGWNIIFLCITTWWLGLGWYQRRPVFMICSDTDFPCSQVKCSMLPHGHRSLCWGGSCDRHGGNRQGCGGRQNVCKNSCCIPAATRRLGHQPLADTRANLLQCRTQAAHAGLGHARPRSTEDVPELGLPPHALAALLQALLWDQICGVKDWLQAMTQAQHYLYGHSAPAALLATAHNVPLRSNSPGVQQCFKGASLLCLKWWGPLSPPMGITASKPLEFSHMN